MKREYRLRDMIKEGILDIFYIWKDELKNVFKDEGVLIFFFLVPFAYPLLYSFIYNNEVVREAKMVVVDQSANAPRDDLAAPLDPDKTEVVRSLVFLHDLVGKSRERTADRRRVHQQPFFFHIQKSFFR